MAHPIEFKNTLDDQYNLPEFGRSIIFLFGPPADRPASSAPVDTRLFAHGDSILKSPAVHNQRLSETYFDRPGDSFPNDMRHDERKDGHVGAILGHERRGVACVSDDEDERTLNVHSHEHCARGCGLDVCEQEIRHVRGALSKKFGLGRLRSLSQRHEVGVACRR